MTGIIKRAFIKRIRGGRPSVPEAILVAAAAGAVAAGATYKVLRG
jgi:hypothetical protein